MQISDIVRAANFGPVVLVSCYMRSFADREISKKVFTCDNQTEAKSNKHGVIEPLLSRFYRNP